MLFLRALEQLRAFFAGTEAAACLFAGTEGNADTHGATVLLSGCWAETERTCPQHVHAARNEKVCAARMGACAICVVCCGCAPQRLGRSGEGSLSSQQAARVDAKLKSVRAWLTQVCGMAVAGDASCVVCAHVVCSGVCA